MRFIAQFVRRRGLDHVIAVAICALMLFFAVGSKVAWYHTKEVAARPIAATKVWKAKSVVVADSQIAQTDVTLQTAVELVSLLAMCLFLSALPAEPEGSVFHLAIESFAALAMRPPPAL